MRTLITARSAPSPSPTRNLCTLTPAVVAPKSGNHRTRVPIPPRLQHQNRKFQLKLLRHRRKDISREAQSQVFCLGIEQVYVRQLAHPLTVEETLLADLSDRLLFLGLRYYFYLRLSFLLLAHLF